MPSARLVETVSVIGLGYIGLPTAAALAESGLTVLGVDTNPEVVEAINRGQASIVEPSLDREVRKAVEMGRLRATLSPEVADAFIIAVPTPLAEGFKPDCSHVWSAAQAIAPVLRAGNVVILESTVPVGTTERMADWLAAQRPDLTFPQHKGEASDIRVAHCPERVLPGQIVRELIENDRVVGGITEECGRAAVALYSNFVAGECHLTDCRTAEMCKLAENAFRDVNIAFANELSMICDSISVDVWELIRLANRHPRVDVLRPGAGVGGHCIPIDPQFVVATSPEKARLIRAAREVNDAKPKWVLDKISQAAASADRARCSARRGVAILGLTFKSGADDLRNSPALQIAEALCRDGAELLFVVEPNIKRLPSSLSGCRLVSFEEALDNADIIALLVAHDSFRRLATALRPGQILIDTVGFMDGARRETAFSPYLSLPGKVA